MRFFASLVTSVVSFAFLKTVIASVHNSGASIRKRHAGGSAGTPPLAKNLSSEVSTLEKRFDGARFSFYKAGLGACGKVNSESDFIVALNQQQFDSGDFCFKTITITYNGKSAQAQIVDRCVECPYGALDFSRGLFDYFASEDLGYIYGSWNLGSGPTPTPKPEPTSTVVNPTPTPTPVTTSTKKSTTARPTTTSSSSSSVAESKTSTSTSSAAPSTSSAIAFPTDTILQLNLALLDLGGVVIGGVLTEA